MEWITTFLEALAVVLFVIAAGLMWLPLAFVAAGAALFLLSWSIQTRRPTVKGDRR